VRNELEGRPGRKWEMGNGRKGREDIGINSQKHPCSIGGEWSRVGGRHWLASALCSHQPVATAAMACRRRRSIGIPLPHRQQKGNCGSPNRFMINQNTRVDHYRCLLFRRYAQSSVKVRLFLKESGANVANTMVHTYSTYIPYPLTQ
jgi:hypothetical protein